MYTQNGQNVWYQIHLFVESFIRFVLFLLFFFMTVHGRVKKLHKTEWLQYSYKNEVEFYCTEYNFIFDFFSITLSRAKSGSAGQIYRKESGQVRHNKMIMSCGRCPHDRSRNGRGAVIHRPWRCILSCGQHAAKLLHAVRRKHTDHFFAVLLTYASGIENTSEPKNTVLHREYTITKSLNANVTLISGSYMCRVHGRTWIIDPTTKNEAVRKLLLS